MGGEGGEGGGEESERERERERKGEREGERKREVRFLHTVAQSYLLLHGRQRNEKHQ